MKANTTEERRAQAAEAAELEFWDLFAKRFPEITTGDLDPFETGLFSQAIERVTKAWLYWNEPDPDLCGGSQCDEIEGSWDCPVCCGRKKEKPGPPPQVASPVGDALFVGTTVRFNRFAFKTIENYEINLSGKTGTVLCVGPGAMEVRLDEHVSDLDPWENTLIWTIEDCLFGERLARWGDVSPEQSYGFFAGYLASMIVS